MTTVLPEGVVLACGGIFWATGEQELGSACRRSAEPGAPNVANGSGTRPILVQGADMDVQEWQTHGPHVGQMILRDEDRQLREQVRMRVNDRLRRLEE